MKINLSNFLFKILLAINFISAIKIPCLDNYIPNISIIYLILNSISFILILFLRPKIRLKGFFKYVLCYYLILFFSMFINGINFRNLFSEAFTTLTIALILNSLNKEEFKKNIDVLALALEILTYINLIIVLLYPDGLYNVGYVRKYFLFDHVNIAIRYLLPGCCFELIRSYLKHNKIDKRCIFYFITVILTLIITLPTTGILGFLAFVLAYILIQKINTIKNIISPFNSILTTGIISYLIIVVNIQTYFANFIKNVLHKDITFTGRTAIWQKALNAISNKPFVGYGRLSLNSRIKILGASSAHNQFLIILFEGGILLLLLIFTMMFNIGKKILKCHHKLISTILVSAIFSYCIMWIAEPFSYTGTVLMFIIWQLAYRSPELFSQNK